MQDLRGAVFDVGSFLIWIRIQIAKNKILQNLYKFMKNIISIHSIMIVVKNDTVSGGGCIGVTKV